jgi:dTDP-4-dehydrorhamnose 3,5-epimerase
VIFTATDIPGAFLIDIEPQLDERGFFSRTVCIDEFIRHGLNARFCQQSVSYNSQRGILRGMHYQAAPWQEEKLVRVTQGAVYDVILDLRPESAAFRKWVAFELSGENRRSIYIPRGVAHGFQTLGEVSEVFYQMTVAFHPESSRGVRWNDPAFGIDWPILPPVMSARDGDSVDFA